MECSKKSEEKKKSFLAQIQKEALSRVVRAPLLVWEWPHI